MFLQMLKELHNGAFDADAAAKLKEVVGAVRATGKTGKLTLTITVKPATKGDSNALVLGDAMKVTLPQLSAGETVFFATNEDALSRRDPRQPELKGLQEVIPMRPRAEEGAVAQ